MLEILEGKNELYLYMYTAVHVLQQDVGMEGINCFRQCCYEVNISFGGRFLGIFPSTSLFCSRVLEREALVNVSRKLAAYRSRLNIVSLRTFRIHCEYLGLECMFSKAMFCRY